MLSPQDQHRIVEQTTAWTDQDFGQVDWSAFPDLNTPPREDKHDDRFAKDWRDTPFSASASALRSFVSDPDRDAIQQLADETGHENLVNEVRDRKGEVEAQKFKAARPSYIPCDENLHSLAVTAAFNWLPPNERNGDDETLINRLIDAGVWDVPHLVACFDALNAEGLMVLAQGEPRNLTERERLRVARLAQAGRVDEAIGEFLRCSLDGDEPDMSMVNDPKYRGLCNDAVYEVFTNATDDYVETSARKMFLLRFAGTRPLTVRLLEQAWKSCQENERRRERGEILNQIERPQPQPVTGTQLDSLDDSAVDRLYHDSLRAYADSVRRAPGVIV